MKSVATIPRILPVASGKGGVGKSMLAANLSRCLAGMGYRVVVADLDLGASNLHTHLGLANYHAGIGDYLKAGGMRLSDLLVKTDQPRLLFLPGDGRIPFMADISYEERHTLIREIRKIPADVIILDLGAGSRFSTLHFFGLSANPLIMTTCETTAIMNMLVFLKNYMFRELSARIRRYPKAVNRVKTLMQRPGRKEMLTMQRLYEEIAALSPELSRRARESMERIRPRLVLNMVEDPRDERMIPKVLETLKNGLGLDLVFCGMVPFDAAVRKAAKQREVMVLHHPQSPYSVAVHHLAGQLANGLERRSSGKRGEMR